MPIKICSDCGEMVGVDRKTKKWWCPNCKEVKNEYNSKYIIAIVGKNAGKKIGEYNMANCLGRQWEKLGHKVFYYTPDDFRSHIEMYDMEDCFHFKKPINIKFIEYETSPDFIFIEQTYYQLDISEINCPVIYQHREYTHFPDIASPDILFASYPYRLHAYEFYRPYEYHKCQYRDYNLVAVDFDLIKRNDKKIFKGIQYLGWALDMWQFAEANGPFARFVIEDQAGFKEECINNGLVQYMEGGSQKRFLDLLGKSEALLFDDGCMNGFGRRIVESMASGTLCIIRIHSKAQKDFYKSIGLTEDMCYFVESVEDVGKIKWTDEEYKKKVNNAYDWIIEHHTYFVRALEVLKKFEEFKNGKKKKPYFMGSARILDFSINDGEVVIE